MGRVGAVEISKSTKRPRTVFEAIENFGHDEDFQENAKTFLFQPTEAPPGSQLKMDVMQRRLELGVPLFHPEDNKRSERVTALSRLHDVVGPRMKVVNDRYQCRKGLCE